MHLTIGRTAQMRSGRAPGIIRMKRLILRHSFVWATLLAALGFSSAGCCHQRIFLRTVDASSQEPLDGVRVEWRQERTQMFERVTHHTLVLPLSSQKGVIEVNGIHCSWNSYFVFSRPGYSNVYGLYQSGRNFLLGHRIVYLPEGEFQGDFYLSGKADKAVKTNGCFVIPMSNAARK